MAIELPNRHLIQNGLCAVPRRRPDDFKIADFVFRITIQLDQFAGTLCLRLWRGDDDSRCNDNDAISQDGPDGRATGTAAAPMSVRYSSFIACRAAAIEAVLKGAEEEVVHC